MTPHEILADLRDIHLPPVDQPPAPLALSPWPFVLLAGLVALVLILRHRRATIWRRQARVRLAEIARLEDPAAACTALLGLLRSLPARASISSLPEAVFLPENRRDAGSADILRRHVEAVIAGQRSRR